MERPVLWKDAYADRPFTNQQRLRSGTVPVLERNPAVTIDDTGKPASAYASWLEHSGNHWYMRAFRDNPSLRSDAHSVAQAGCGRMPAMGCT